MHGESPNELQSLQFDNLTLSPTRVNWVERWSKVHVISFIGPMMWVCGFKKKKIVTKYFLLNFFCKMAKACQNNIVSMDGLYMHVIMNDYKLNHN